MFSFASFQMHNKHAVNEKHCVEVYIMVYALWRCMQLKQHKKNGTDNINIQFKNLILFLQNIHK